MPKSISALWRFDSALALKAIAAGLIHAVVYWPSAAFDLILPLQSGLELQLRPSLVVPVFVGLTQGPWAGALTGALGHLLGELLAGRVSGAGPLAIGLLQNALLGFLAGLGSAYLRRERSLATLGAAALWTVIAAVGANLLPFGLLILVVAVRPGLALDGTLVISGLLTTLVNTLLLLPTLLWLWGRNPPRQLASSRPRNWRRRRAG